MGATVLAVVGTLLGSIVAGLFQHKSAGRTERVARAEQLRKDQMEAATALAVAVSDHRSAMWVRGDAVLKGDTDDRVRELKVRTHETRSAVTRPLIALKLHIIDLAVQEAAVAMVSATYGMRAAYGSTAELTQARESAMLAHDTFVDTAAAFLAR
jgi:hypothetical protein